MPKPRYIEKLQVLLRSVKKHATKKAIFLKKFTLYKCKRDLKREIEMGFLLFAARKLQLKRQINQLSYRQMQLSQEQQQISEQIAQQQQRQQQVQNSINYINTLSNSLANISTQNNIYNAYKQGGNELQQAGALMLAGNNAFNPTTLATNVMNSVFTAQNNMQLVQLQNKDNLISTELESIDSQLKLAQAEYENVKKAESSEAQNCAPTFGLA